VPIRLPSKPKIFGYVALTLAGAIAAGFYFNDFSAPRLDNFSTSKQVVSVKDPAPQFEFSGQLSDARGVTNAEFQCVEDGETRLLIYLAMAGSDRNRVSFGQVSGSFGWAGRWFGTSYDLRFEGLANLPPNLETTHCEWFAKLGDILGNETYVDTGLTLVVNR